MCTESLARCSDFQVVAGCGIKCNISTEDISNILVSWDANTKDSGNDVVEVQVAADIVDTLIGDDAPVIDTGGWLWDRTFVHLSKSSGFFFCFCFVLFLFVFCFLFCQHGCNRVQKWDVSTCNLLW